VHCTAQRSWAKEAGRVVRLGRQQINFLAEVGKDIWASKDQSKYEQYCIYESNNEEKKARKAKAEAG
jgi:hypothetical protein